MRDEPPKARGIFYNKNLMCDVKMEINDNICVKIVRTHNTVLHAKIAQSYVLASGHFTPRLCEILDSYILLFLNSTLFRFDSTFWLDSHA